MIVGCLGDIVFKVSEQVVRTISNYSRSASVSYSTHQRHLRRGLPEFTGIDPESITFTIVLSNSLGVSPENEMVKIRSYMVTGKTMPLVIGTRTLGVYRWVITSYKATVTALREYSVDLTLMEYPES